MRRFLLVLALTCIAATGARANVVVITIDKSHQRMSVSVNGEDRYNWPISTARAGYNTPNGTYHPRRPVSTVLQASAENPHISVRFFTALLQT
jgi:lipoprotein-anchoring transpeptidase ErfK/SrfK